jgi:uncharacterized membrane protein YgdD (TMEM256/DUF423 family)
MDMQVRAWMALAAMSGLMAVAAGAFGAHGVADAQAKAWLQTGAHYQLTHALAVFGCYMVWRSGGAAAQPAAWMFLAGGLIFGGSLYLMALGAPRWFGAITPIGGGLLLLGWATLAYAILMGARTTLV